MITQILFRIVLCSMALNMTFYPLHSGIAAVWGYLMVVSFFVYSTFEIVRGHKLSIRKWDVVLILLVLFSTILRIGSISASDILRKIQSILSFLCVYGILASAHCNNMKMCLDDLYKYAYYLCGVFALYTFGPFSFKYTEYISDGWPVTSFTMGLGNPSSVSITVLFVLMIMIVHSTETKRKALRIFDVILICFLVYILLKLRSRTAVACGVFILLYSVIYKKKKTTKLISYGAVFVPLLMISVHMILGELDQRIAIFGKTLASGRSDIFGVIIGFLKESPFNFLFGNIWVYAFENSHNAVMAVIATLGFCGLVWFYIFWISKIHHFEKKSMARYQRIAYVSLLVFFINSSSEAAVLVGSLPYGIYLVVIVQIIKGNITKKNNIRLCRG